MDRDVSFDLTFFIAVALPPKLVKYTESETDPITHNLFVNSVPNFSPLKLQVVPFWRRATGQRERERERERAVLQNIFHPNSN